MYALSGGVQALKTCIWARYVRYLQYRLLNYYTYFLYENFQTFIIGFVANIHCSEAVRTNISTMCTLNFCIV